MQLLPGLFESSRSTEKASKKFKHPEITMLERTHGGALVDSPAEPRLLVNPHEISDM